MRAGDLAVTGRGSHPRLRLGVSLRPLAATSRLRSSSRWSANLSGRWAGQVTATGCFGVLAARGRRRIGQQLRPTAPNIPTPRSPPDPSDPRNPRPLAHNRVCVWSGIGSSLPCSWGSGSVDEHHQEQRVRSTTPW